MRSRVALTAAALIVLLGALSRPAAPASAVVYTTKKSEWHDPACRPSKDVFSCAHIAFTYPVIERAPHPAAAGALNRAVREYLLTSVGEPKRYASIEAAFEAFRQLYEAYKKDNRTPAALFEERVVSVLYQSPPLISIQFDTDFYYGGLHPQYAGTFASFDATTGSKIKLDDVLVAGYRPRLTRIAENQFRAHTGIKPGTTLHDAGYIFFKDDTFSLNDNYWFGPKGLTFFYNPYEIAPYSMGTTELLLTYRQIGELIRPDGLLRALR